MISVPPGPELGVLKSVAVTISDGSLALPLDVNVQSGSRGFGVEHLKFRILCAFTVELTRLMLPFVAVIRIDEFRLVLVMLLPVMAIDVAMIVKFVAGAGELASGTAPMTVKPHGAPGP
jgi:hypothetical protein